MCGIAGAIIGDEAKTRTATARMNAAISHRGPDSSGEEYHRFGERWLGLGHRRLAILDLSPMGYQPMVHPPTGSRIIFNGEVYNFPRLRVELEREGETFRSGSDTEVILAGLARHGRGYLSKLEGMYALAFYNAREGSLLLARDPAGIKPLYIAKTDDGGLVFASETRAILSSGLVPSTIRRSAVASYLAYGAVQHPHTLFTSIQSLAPGSSLQVFADGTFNESSHWALPPARVSETIPKAVETVRATLTRAVKDHLISDVPVGLFLSSGLDSTLLAGLAGRECPSLRSFTVVFEDNPDFSEKDLAARTAAQYGLSHTELPLSADAAENAVAKWLKAIDQPSIDGLNVFVISQAVREHGIKVALTGLGGDEVFGGYASFRDVPRLYRVAGKIAWMPRRMRRVLAGLAYAGKTQAVREKLKDMLGGPLSLRSLSLQRRRAMSNRQLLKLGFWPKDLGLDEDYLPENALPDIDTKPTDPLRIVSQVEFRQYQVNMLLRDGDTMGMAFGLEIRVPFLDQQLIEYGLSLPGTVKRPPGAPGKYLLRQAFPDLLRPEILNQPKRGFTLPIQRWMLGSLKSTCERALGILQNSGLMNPDGVAETWREFQTEPDSPMWSRAFALVVLGDYVARHGGRAA